MQTANYHLLFNHFPIVVPVIGIIIMLTGMILRNSMTRRVALFIFIIGALCTIPASLTGEGAEEAIEHLPGISEDLIHEHEEMAESFTLLSYALGALALLGLLADWKNSSFSRIVQGVVLLMAFVILFFAFRTGHSGGLIRHPEISSTVQNDGSLDFKADLENNNED